MVRKKAGMSLFIIFLEISVQSLKFKVCCFHNEAQCSCNHENRTIKFPLNTFSDQITIWKFLFKSIHSSCQRNHLLSSESKYPANIYLFKVSNRNCRKRCEKYLKLTMKSSTTSTLTLNIFHTSL